MARTNTKKRIVWTLVILFVVMNTVAFLHAWKFTHYKKGLATKTSSDVASLSLMTKLRIVVAGIDNPRPENKVAPARPFENMRLQSNKQIACWLLRTDLASKGTVLLCHGYVGEKSSMLDKADVFLQMGYNTLLIDFMGSGDSEGNQTTIGYREAAEVKTCVDYLHQQGEKNIILFGTSMGSAAIMKALHDQPLPVSCAILECPFSTLLQTVKNRFASMHIPTFPMAHLLVFWGGVQNGFNGFAHNPESYASSMRCPVLLLYGEKDEKVTRAETDSILIHLAGPKKLVTFPLAAHENYLRKYKPEWTAAVTDFLNTN